MKNMRKLLSAMAVLGFTTVSAVNVVACNNGTTTKALAAKVSEVLGLTDTDGKGKLAPNIDIAGTDKTASWKVALTDISVGKLVDGDSKAKEGNADIYSFLKDTLKIKVDSGTTAADTVFNPTQISAATITVSNIKITLAAYTDKTDYYVSIGTYDVKFTNGDTTTDTYSVLTSLGTATTGGVVATSIPDLATADFNADFQAAFKEGQPTSAFAKDKDVTTMFGASTATDTNKQIKSVQQLINQGALGIVVTKNDSTGPNFASGDIATFGVKIGDVTLKTTELTVLAA